MYKLGMGNMRVWVWVTRSFPNGIVRESGCTRALQEGESSGGSYTASGRWLRDMSLKPTKPTNDLLHHTCTTTAHYKHAAINAHRHTHAAQQWTGPLKKATDRMAGGLAGSR